MHKRVCFVLLWSFLCCIKASSQTLFPLSFPHLKGNEQVVFKAIFKTDSNSLKTRLTLVCKEIAQVYVNGRNVSNHLCASFQSKTDTTWHTYHYALERFLLPKENTLMVILTPKKWQEKVLQMGLWVQQAQPQQGWSIPLPLTNQVYASTNTRWKEDETLHIDGNKNLFYWQNQQGETPLWKPICTKNTFIYMPWSVFLPPHKAQTKTQKHITQFPLYFDLQPNSIEYAFPQASFGFVRITLRGTKAKQQVQCGHIIYTCNGTLDEQIVAPFAPYFYRHFSIKTNKHISSSNIMKVEGITSQTQEKNILDINSY